MLTVVAATLLAKPAPAPLCATPSQFVEGVHYVAFGPDRAIKSKLTCRNGTNLSMNVQSNFQRALDEALQQAGVNETAASGLANESHNLCLRDCDLATVNLTNNNLFKINNMPGYSNLTIRTNLIKSL